MLWDMFDEEEPAEGRHRAGRGWWALAGAVAGWLLVWVVAMTALIDWPLLVDCWRMATGALEAVR